MVARKTTDLANHCAFCGDENRRGQPFRVPLSGNSMADLEKMNELASRVLDLDARLRDLKVNVASASLARVGFLPECRKCHDARTNRKGSSTT